MIGSSSDPLVDEDMEEILRSGVLDDEPPHQSPLLGDEQISAEDGSVVRDVKGMPAPRQPTRDEVSRHNITHLPYRSWCPICVASRRPNSSHRTSKNSTSRSIPVFVADYCFVRKPNEELLTGSIGKLYPSHAIF